MTDIIKEIEAMSNLINADESTSVIDEPIIDEPTVTDEPVVDESVVDEPTVDEPVADEPIVDKPSEMDDLRNTINGLKEEIKKLSESKSPVVIDIPVPDAPTPDEDFIGDNDLDDIVRDKSAFNKLLNAVHKKGIEIGKLEYGKVVQSLPNMIKDNIIITEKLKEASDTFYAENEDLKSFKRVVGVVFEEIASKDPSKTYDEILKDVGPEVRKRLDLKQNVKSNDKETVPKLPKKGTQSRQTTQKPEIDPLISELEAMNKSLEL